MQILIERRNPTAKGHRIRVDLSALADLPRNYQRVIYDPAIRSEVGTTRTRLVEIARLE